jgi:ribosomal protein S18 acetylase RimI-like enzyme
MNNYKYKKYTFNKLLKKLETPMFKNFFDIYINDYLSKVIHINSIKEFVEKNNKFIDFYLEYDINSKIYFHILIDKNEKSIVAIEKSLYINNNFFNIKYFKPLVDYIDINKSNFHIYYVMNLYIDPNYRGKKLCNYLTSRINKNAIKNNIKCIIAEIHKDNTISIKCNTNAGFNKTPLLSYKDTYFYINNLL